MAYAVVRTDKMIGTDVRSELVSVRYQPGDTMTEIENGNVVKLGALETGSREIYKGVTPAANDDITAIVLVASPEIMYDERKRNLDEFINKAGTIARAYRLHKHDIFSVTKDALDGAATPAVGDVVELKAGTKLNVVAAASGATQGSTVVGKIIDINIVGRYTYYAIEVA
ncbi:MAG: hypothetical protein II410_05475 [Ruminococcus sp.]|nr:hypothetical protein [Ruminococcus sp.]